jgi:hypothetical protein
MSKISSGELAGLVLATIARLTVAHLIIKIVSIITQKK